MINACTTCRDFTLRTFSFKLTQRSANGITSPPFQISSSCSVALLIPCEDGQANKAKVPNVFFAFWLYPEDLLHDRFFGPLPPHQLDGGIVHTTHHVGSYRDEGERKSDATITEGNLDWNLIDSLLAGSDLRA